MMIVIVDSLGRLSYYERNLSIHAPIEIVEIAISVTGVAAVPIVVSIIVVRHSVR